jgi:hypothetical protein
MIKVVSVVTIALLAVNAFAGGEAEHSVFFYSSKLPKLPVESK